MTIKFVFKIITAIISSPLLTTAAYRRNNNRLGLVAIIFTLFFQLSSCGGGGGSPSTPSPPDPAVSVDPPTGNVPISFVNPGPEGEAVSINGDLSTSAMQKLPDILFNATGEGISIWSIETGTGLKVVYSLYDPVNLSWSEETVLYYGSLIEQADGFSLLLEFKVATNGSGFAITWTNSGNIFAKIYDPGAVTPWSDDAKLTTNTNYQKPKISSNGSEYVVTWIENNKVVSSMSSGPQWSATPIIIGDVVPPGTPATLFNLELDITSNNQGYLVSWLVNERKLNPASTSSYVYSSLYSAAGGWGNIVQMNETNLDLDVRTLKIKSNLNGYIVS